VRKKNFKFQKLRKILEAITKVSTFEITCHAGQVLSFSLSCQVMKLYKVASYMLQHSIREGYKLFAMIYTFCALCHDNDGDDDDKLEHTLNMSFALKCLENMNRVFQL
jgi:hypothetical protein